MSPILQFDNLWTLVSLKLHRVADEVMKREPLSI